MLNVAVAPCRCDSAHCVAKSQTTVKGSNLSLPRHPAVDTGNRLTGLGIFSECPQLVGTGLTCQCPKLPFTSSCRKSSTRAITVSRGCGPVREMNCVPPRESRIRVRSSSEFLYLDIEVKNSRKPKLKAILRRNSCPAYPEVPRRIDHLFHLHFVRPNKPSTRTISVQLPASQEHS
jgi:hypothetical protein